VVNDLWVAKSDMPMFPLKIIGFLKTPQEYLLSLWISQVHRLTKLFPFTAVLCFSTLCTNINLSDLKTRMKVLVSKVINRMLSRCFKFLLGQNSALNLRCIWLKNTEELRLRESIQTGWYLIWTSAVITFGLWYVGQGSIRDCSEGNGQGNKQDCHHCRDYQGSFIVTLTPLRRYDLQVCCSISESMGLVC
jgi:hypothetical protein